MIRVAVGLLRDASGQVLINQRKADGHHPGRWEFPGGKLESGETPVAALERELREELGIEIVSARPRIRLQHQYPERHVELSVWDVTKWRGEVHGCEGHSLRWVPISSLSDIDLLEADIPIVTSLRLPALYAVTPSADVFATDSAEGWLHRLSDLKPNDDVMIQLRLPKLEDSAYAIVASVMSQQCTKANVRLMLNGDPAIVIPLARSIAAAGVQIPARYLTKLENLRDDARGLLVAASCHNEAELGEAESRGVDFAVLGAVTETKSHPGASVLGWSGFASLAAAVNLPVYAIGGVGPDDQQTAWANGAQGVAGISRFWDEEL